MATVKLKFRPSSVDGKEGSVYYQVIHNRVAMVISMRSEIVILGTLILS